jgi:hypothetical protein
VALEGSEYFRSATSECPHCLRQPEAKGQGHYSHKIVGATLVRAGAHHVVPLDVEGVRTATVESAPQDCEWTAGKRLIARLRREHPQMALIVIGADLYAHVPFVEQLPPLRQHYVLVAKPASHPTLRTAVAAAEGTAQSQSGQWPAGRGARQRTYTYRLGRHMPLARESAVRVNYVEVWEHAASGTLLYPNSWITDLDVDAANGAVGVQIGRTRGKREKEQFKVHTNHGDELTHNYGHGQQTLAMVSSLLNLLADVAHMVLALGERLSQRCRGQESRRELWAALRTLVNAFLVESWRHLLEVYLEDADASP